MKKALILFVGVVMLLLGFIGGLNDFQLLVQNNFEQTAIAGIAQRVINIASYDPRAIVALWLYPLFIGMICFLYLYLFGAIQPSPRSGQDPT